MPDSFAQRHGLAGPLPGTLLRDTVPVSFRRMLIDLPHTKIGVEIEDIHSVVCDVLQVWADASIPPYFDYQSHLKDCKWFRIYDVIEGLYRFLCKKHSPPSFVTNRFVKTINDAFISQNIGWKLENGKVVTRGDEQFENTLKTASTVLTEDKKPTAAQHLHSAINALSAKPRANTSGAVTHSTSAVECVLGEITGQALTLGEYLKKHSSLFHPALKKGLEGLYGYASDEGARHGKEGTEPSLEDAEFVLATCAAVCTLLTKRNRKSPG